jgi:tripartite ATP-independent transporter DctM subunit
MEQYEIIVVVMLGTFIVSLFSGFPVAWLLGGLSLIFAAIGVYGTEYFEIDAYYMTDWARFTSIVDRVWSLMENWVLVALPMFIYMGLMLERSGIAEHLMQKFIQVFGRFRGGLALAVVLIGILLAASTGIVGASVVLLAVLSMPIMLQQNYSKSFSSGVCASAGTLGILIPPSIMLVIMADQLSLSVGNLFMGALLPGVLLGGLYILYILVAANLKPNLAPAPKDLPPITGKLIWETMLAVVPPIVLILAVLGSIFFGIATPTEASGIGAFGATMLALINRRLNWKVVDEVGRQTMLTTAFIFGIFLGASAFALSMRWLGGDKFIEHMLTSLPFHDLGIVIFILFLAFLAGFFLDWLEITLIFLPLMAPVIRGLDLSLLSINGDDQVYWFVVLFAVTLQTSFLTPPVGFSLFYLKGVVPPGVTTIDIYKGIIPFVLLQLAAITLVFVFPELVLWLPRVAYGN